MNRNKVIAWAAVLILVSLALFFALGGPRIVERALGGSRPNFGEFGDTNSYFARIGVSLGLPENATKEQVLEALGLPEDASPEQVTDALQEKGITPMRRN